MRFTKNGITAIVPKERNEVLLIDDATDESYYLTEADAGDNGIDDFFYKLIDLIAGKEEEPDAN